MTNDQSALGVFGRYLSAWVALAIVVGVLLGRVVPEVPRVLARAEVASISLPVAVLIWLMILPMMVQVDFASVRNVRREPVGLTVTTAMNWLVKPFTMFAIAWLFLVVIFRPFIDDALAREYLAGAVLLGAAPCTAMVFVWSLMVKGDPAYTVVQVAFNDLVMLFAFAPIVVFLLQVSDVDVPWSTMVLSVLLYIVIPLVAGWIIRNVVVRSRGAEWFHGIFVARISRLTPVGLVATLVLLFAFQGDVLTERPFHIALIAVPLVIQTVLIYALTFRTMKVCRVPFAIAAPGALVGASNFFELAVATAIALFGLRSGAALATVVGVLVEVPLMLALVRHANAKRTRFAS